MPKHYGMIGLQMMCSNPPAGWEERKLARILGPVEAFASPIIQFTGGAFNLYFTPGVCELLGMSSPSASIT